MSAPNIVRLAVDNRGMRAITADVSGQIVVWDLESRLRISSFGSVYNFPAGGVLLPTNDMSLIRSTQYGLAAYSIPDGRLLWARKEIPVIHIVKGQRRYFVVDGYDSLYEIDVYSSKTFEVEKGVTGYFQSAISNASLTVWSRSEDYRVIGEYTFSIEKLSFGVLDVAFSSQCVFISEAGGPVRAVDISFGVELGRFEPRQGWHVLWLHWQPGLDALFGVLFNYNTNQKRLLRFASDLSERTELCDVAPHSIHAVSAQRSSGYAHRTETS